MQNNQNISIKRATLINSAAKYYSVLCSFVLNMILSRILTPSEYGVVSVVTVFTTFFTLFSDLGFGIAYIQRKDATPDDRNNLFSFLVYVGCALFVLFFFFAYFIAWFYNDDIYIPIARLLGLNLLLTAVNVIPNSDLLKQQRFRTVAAVQAVATTVSAIIAVILAFHGFSYYAIVFQSLTNTAITTIIYIILTKPRFVFRIDKKSISKFTSLSVGQLGFNFINYFSRNMDNLLIGRIFGSEQLGYYDKAYKTSTYAISNISSIIGNSIQPVLSKYQDDTEYVYQKFKRSFLFLLLVGLFLSVFLNLSSKEVILVLYGNQWNASIVPFSFLALSLFAQMSLNITGAFYQVLNNTKLLAAGGMISAILLVGGICIGLSHGSITSVALCYFIAQCLNFAITIFLMSKFLFQRTVKDLLAIMFRMFLAAGISYGICYLIFGWIHIESNFLLLVIKFIICLVICVMLAVLFRVDEYVFTVVFPKYKNPLYRKAQ